MLNNREYLHLEEAESIPGLTKFQIVQFFRENKINLYLHCDTIKLFATGVFKGNQRTSVLGSFNYSGVVTTDRSLVNDLLRKNQTIKANNFIVLEPNNVTEWNNEKPKIAFPNEKYLSYKHTPKPERPFRAVVRFVSWSRHTMGEKLTGLLNSQVDPMLTDKPEKEKELKKAMSDLTKAFSKKLSYESKEFYPDDLRFNKKELLILLNNDDSIIKAAQEKATHPIDEIIERVIRYLGNVNVNVIWNKFKIDSKSPDDERLYDIENLLDTVENEELSYRLRGGNISHIGHNTFKKYVTRVRNKLKAEGLISK